MLYGEIERFFVSTFRVASLTYETALAWRRRLLVLFVIVLSLSLLALCSSNNLEVCRALSAPKIVRLQPTFLFPNKCLIVTLHFSPPNFYLCPFVFLHFGNICNISLYLSFLFRKTHSLKPGLGDILLGCKLSLCH